MAFKIVEDPFGQLTFMRIYQGNDHEGFDIRQSANGPKSERFSRNRANALLTSAKRSTEATAGDIVAVMGIDCASWRHLRRRKAKYVLAFENMFVPDPVIKIAVKPRERASRSRQDWARRLQRFRKEDPTFRVDERRRDR